MNQRAMYTLFIGATLVLAACAAGATESPATDPSEPTTPTAASPVEDPVTEPTAPEESNVKAVPPLSVARSYGESDYPSELSGIVKIAVDDLAGRLDIDANEIAIVSVEEVLWSDASVGCPDPDMNYAQVVTDGLRIVLVVEGAEYAYHSGGSVEPFLCLDKPAADSSDVVGAGDNPDVAEISTTEGTLQLEKTTTPKETAPTQQPGGPGGQPDE